MSQQAGRRVTVAPERLAGWVARFAAQHGDLQPGTGSADALLLRAADGNAARIFLGPGSPGGIADRLAEAAGRRADERLGLVVARRGGYSVGVAHGPRIVAHRTGSRYVQGRTAAGGWSQQRYARRRGNQAAASFAAAADAAAAVLLPHVDTLTRVVAGGDRQAVREVLADPRLAPVAALLEPAMHAVGAPKRASLDVLLASARAVVIELIPAA